MQTFKEFYIEEGKLGKAIAMGTLAASSVFGNFVNDWTKYYQTTNNPAKEARATKVLDKLSQIPSW